MLLLTGIVVLSLMTIIASGGGGDGDSNDEINNNGDNNNGDDDNGGDNTNTNPIASISSPADGIVYTYNDYVVFTGTGSDAEDGALSGSSLVWTSDIDGQIGTGASIDSSALSLGDHVISLTASDSEGKTGSSAIKISIKSWTHPTGLTDNISPEAYDAASPQVAMDSNGNAIITWQQGYPGLNRIYKSEYRNGAWILPGSLDDYISPDGVHAGSPQVAMNSNGNAIIIWMQSVNLGGNIRTQIYKSEYRNGTWVHPAGPDDYINPYGESVFNEDNSRNPQVAMDNNGNAIITWEQYDGSHYQIFRSEYRNGEWTHPDDLTATISPMGTNAGNPQVAMDNNGNAIITWQQYDGSHVQILKSERRNGDWTDPISIDDNISPDGQDASNPQVAMDNNDNAIITWMQWYNNSYTQIFKSEFRDGSWTHPAGLTDNISPDEQGAYSPQVAMDSSGNAIITWMQWYDSSNRQIFKSEYRNGTWTDPSGLTDNISPDGQDASNPQVAMDSSGNAIITWMQWYDGVIFQIYKSEYRNGTWVHPASLDDNISPDEQNASNPQVTMDSSGNAIITWQQNDGSKIQIFKSEYR